MFSIKFLSQISLFSYSVLDSNIPSEHIIIISFSFKSLSYTTKSILSNIPAGNVTDFTVSTLFLDLIKVGQAPFFTNYIFPLFKSTIEISIVAYVSSFEFKLIAEFIRPIETSLSNPLVSNLFNILITVWLLLLADAPEPIPSLIASIYFPSSSFVIVLLSPDISLLFFVLVTTALVKVYFSSFFASSFGSSVISSASADITFETPPKLCCKYSFITCLFCLP